MGNISSVLTSPLETVVSCGGAFDNIEGNGLFSEVIHIKSLFVFMLISYLLISIDCE